MVLNSLTAQLKRWRLHGSCPFCDTPLKNCSSTPRPLLSRENKDRPATLPVCQQCFTELPWCNEAVETIGERSAFYYAAPIREYILAGKSSSQPAKLQLLGQLMAARFTKQLASGQLLLPQAIIPVPLHRSRLRQRGFNQSIELISPFARQHNIPLLRQTVYRNRDTGEQKDLTESMRKTNIANAFSIAEPVNYQHVAIFDDVITTGATCAALRELLLQHGVNKVEIWCCATTNNDLTV